MLIAYIDESGNTGDPSGGGSLTFTGSSRFLVNTDCEMGVHAAVLLALVSRIRAR